MADGAEARAARAVFLAMVRRPAGTAVARRWRDLSGGYLYGSAVPIGEMCCEDAKRAICFWLAPKWRSRKAFLNGGEGQKKKLTQNVAPKKSTFLSRGVSGVPAWWSFH